MRPMCRRTVHVMPDSHESHGYAIHWALPMSVFSLAEPPQLLGASLPTERLVRIVANRPDETAGWAGVMRPYPAPKRTNARRTKCPLINGEFAFIAANTPEIAGRQPDRRR